MSLLSLAATIDYKLIFVLDFKFGTKGAQHQKGRKAEVAQQYFFINKFHALMTVINVKLNKIKVRKDSVSSNNELMLNF